MLVILGNNSIYIVAYAYCKVSDSHASSSTFPTPLGCALESIWGSLTPSKVLVFSWQLLQDKIPTRENRHIMRIILDSTICTCILCDGSLESAFHFLSLV